MLDRGLDTDLNRKTFKSMMVDVPQRLIPCSQTPCLEQTQRSDSNNFILKPVSFTKDFVVSAKILKCLRVFPYNSLFQEKVITLMHGKEASFCIISLNRLRARGTISCSEYGSR